MPIISELSFSLEIEETHLEVDVNLIEPIVLSRRAWIAVEFETVTWYNEVGGPWQGDVSIVGLDGDEAQPLFHMASFVVPRFRLPDPASVKSEVRPSRFAGTLPVEQLDEDPEVDVEGVLDGAYWVPGYGPWIDFEGPSGVRIPRPWGGNPQGGPAIPSHIGYTRYFAYLRRSSREDEIAAVVALRDGSGSSHVVRSNQVVIDA